LPTLDALLTQAASLVNGIYLPAATPGSVGMALIAAPCLIAVLWLARRLRAGPRADLKLASQLEALHQRLETSELLLADAASEVSQLRQRVDHLALRQDASGNGNSRSGLRQAIALSRHGATTRQLVDTCGLSQGEAHLIQTLYGRAPGAPQPEELH
jgi:hypothetical protein